jgi:farnesyl-diphosphate farnesyltransferase
MNKWIQNEVNLKAILKGVSRSFYLSLILLPPRIKHILGLGYLFCRAADTIADTDILPSQERLKIIELYRTLFRNEISLASLETIAKKVVHGGGLDAEEELMKNLPACFKLLEKLNSKEQTLLKDLVLELTLGMKMDLEKFSSSGGKLTEEELDQYTYYVAGVVGKFWTKVLYAHYSNLIGTKASALETWGIEFGKGLQLVNIIRDYPVDAQRGRLYFPVAQREEKIQLALKYLNSGWKYVEHLPLWTLRLRWVCILPLLLGEQTLKLIQSGTSKKIKLTRRKVYLNALLSFFFFWNLTLLRKIAS